MVSRRSFIALAATTGAVGVIGTPTARAGGSNDGGLVATSEPGCSVDPHLKKHDFRGIWIASVANIDWPSKPGLSAEQQRAELTSLLDVAQARHYNAVILQVRPTADTFWPSELEPWAHWLTGSQGVDPGWDPLGYAVEAAHARNLELHAWFNPFRVAMDEAGAKLLPSHPARQHPEWTVPYGGKLYCNPGIPEVRDHSIAVIMEAVKRYNIDAVHFDDYFYPYPVAGKVFDDADEYARHGNGLSLADWRRANINDLVQRLGDQIKAAKPHVQFGISPFAVWRNAATDPTGSQTTAGAQTYDDLYADTRLWVREAMVDYMLPQVYWSKTLAAASYVNVTKWWVDEARGKDVNLYIGQATYKIAANADTAWNDPREMVSHLEFNEQFADVIQGNVFYNATSVRANLVDGMGIVEREWYAKPALTPRMAWIDATPSSPVASRGRVDSTLSWSAPADAHQFVVYRVAKKAKDVRPCDLADTRNLVAILPAGTTTWTDPEVTSAQGQYTWLVSAVDRGSNESAARMIR